MSEPRCIEVSASVTWGASVQVIKYEYTPKFSYTFTRKYEVPSDWTEDDAQRFQREKAISLREELDALVQMEMDELAEERERLLSG